MKKSKILVLVVVLLLLTSGSVLGLLTVSGRVLVKYGVAPVQGAWSTTVSLPYTLAKRGATKKARGAGAIGLGASVLLPVLIFGFMGVMVLFPKKRGLHGDARFANELELRKAGLLQPDKPGDQYPSIVIGKYKDKFLLYRGQQFAFLAAPTRSGKGVGFVVPNLLHYRDSVVNLDIKDENFQMTAGFRAACGQEVYKFSPDAEDGLTDCWNPLGYVRHDPLFRMSDLMDITNSLYPPSDDVWNSTAEGLFLGLALYIMDTSKEHENFNIATVKKYRVLLPFLADVETFRKYIEQRKPYEPLSEECIQYLMAYAETSEKTRASIAISFDKPLGIYADPITARATKKNTFDLRDVRKRRMTIYVSIKPKTIDKYGELLNLFFQQLLKLNMDVLPQDDPENLKYQCLVLLDEFAAMGRVAVVEKASAYMAGYNMRLFLVFQSKSQLQDDKLYGKTGAQTMLTNMALQVCYAPREDDDAKDYSEMIGYMTEKGLSKSRQLSGKGGRSESESEQRRAVLLPQEVKGIGLEKEIISLENMPPALADKIFWYKEPVFQARANKPTPPLPDQRVAVNTIEPNISETLHFAGAIRDQALGRETRFEVGFSPKRNALEVVMSLILLAEKELLVAAYSFTSRPIALALSEAKARGVDVRMVVDNEQNASDQGGYRAIDYVISQGIPVRRCVNYACMHHKFMVADGQHVQLGSFNYTASANSRNAETAITFRNVPDLAGVYRTEWLRLANEPEVTPEDIEQVDAALAYLRDVLNLNSLMEK